MELSNQEGFYKLGIFVYIILNYNEDMERLIDILNVNDYIKYYTNDVNNIIELIQENKHFIYDNQFDMLINKIKLYLSKKISIDTFITFFLESLKIKTSYFGLLHCSVNDDYFIDVGVYGKSKIKVQNKLNKLEKFTFNNKGLWDNTQ